MISLKVIKKYGLDSRNLKKYFTAKVPDPNVARLVQLVADRIKDGRLRNMSDYRAWAAVDFAYDTPFAQTTPTLLRGLMEGCDSTEDVLRAMRGYGISEETMFNKVPIEGGHRWELNEPLFYNVYVPLVRAYVTIRLSKLFNDRNLTPLFEYPPREFTAENRLLCKILTEVVESVSSDFNYSSTLRDFIFNALMYSVSIKFPMEPWTRHVQEDEDGNQVIEKEGVRYMVPHITRTYWDMTCPLSTLNTGTGCSFAGYWTVLKWGDVAMDTTLWNRNSVPHGTNWLDPNAQWYNYFKEAYPCTLEFPVPRGNRKNDRENMAFRYTRTDYDSAFFLTYHYAELVPADWGLGDYPHKVWMRFTVGGDSTIMFAEVFRYHPLNYIGYDADSGRGRNASLALEIIPFQDITGNALTNFLLTVKRNLANIIFYDTDSIDKDQLQSLNRKSNDQFGKLNFLGYSSLAQQNQGNDIQSAFKQVNFQYADPTPSILAVNTTITMLERLLGMAAQEIGASASHQQSKKEVEITNANTSNRLAYTGSFVDEGVYSWMIQLAEAVISHMDGKEVMATIPTDIPNLEEALQKIGFEFASTPPGFGEAKTVVKGKLTRQHLVQFIARRSDATRENDTQAATVMMQAVQAIANSQILSAQVDPSSLIELMEYAAKLGGADDDFKIRLNVNAVLADKLQSVVQGIQQQIMQAVEKEVAQPAAQAIAGVKNSSDTNAQQAATAIQKLDQALAQIQQAVAMSGALPTPSVSMKMPPPNGAPVVAPIPPQPSVAPQNPATTTPNALVPSNPQHVDVAKKYLATARGNKKKAREMAAADGFKL